MDSPVRGRSKVQPLVAPLMLATLLLACMPLTGASIVSAQEDDTSPASCHVTLPNGNLPPAEVTAPYTPANHAFFGNGDLWVVMWWENGVIRAGIDAGVMQPGGVSIKTPWVQGPDSKGDLKIVGRRLDGPAPAINQEEGAGEGFHPTGIVYPTPGCWQITGNAGATSLTFTVWVTFTPEIARKISPTRNCPVTTNADGDPGLPQYVIPGTRQGGPGTPPATVYPTPDDFFGENGLWVGLWPAGVVRVDARSNYVTSDGGVSMKFWMYRDDAAKGHITISGRRLDGAAPPLTGGVPSDYGSVGFQATGIDFPTPGCWEVTVHSGNAALTFVTLVEIVPAGAALPATPSATPSAQSECQVTTNADGDPGLPQYLITGFSIVGPGTPGALRVGPDNTLIFTATPGATPVSIYAGPDDFYGQGGLWVALPPTGKVGGVSSSNVGPGNGINVKYPMYRDDEARGRITITGRRLDGAAPPLTASVPEGYGDVGFQATSITYPTSGCWQVTVQSGSATLTFVTLVKIVPAPTPVPDATPRAVQSSQARTLSC